MSLAIVNYGLANLRSVEKAFAAVGHEARIVADPDAVRAAEKIVLPGVGAVGDALRQLRATGLEGAILDHISAGKPFLGVCLGMQMLFDVCHEGGEHRGLGVLPGRVVRFDAGERAGLKVPHMGWNTLDVRRRDCPLFGGVAEGASVYFVHSYHAVCQDPSDAAATCDHGGAFAAAVWRENVMAVQFHPEKSQAVGLRMLANFAAM